MVRCTFCPKSLDGNYKCILLKISPFLTIIFSPDTTRNVPVFMTCRLSFKYLHPHYSTASADIALTTTSTLTACSLLLTQAAAFTFKMPFPACRNSETNDQQEGFSFGGFKLFQSDLKKRLQMNVSPKSLETLQKILDTIFDAYSSSGK